MKKLTIKISILLTIATMLMVVGCGVKTQVVSTETLLKEMVDKRDVTYYPEHYYTTKQFSSYDRASDKNDPNHHTWFANEDWSSFLRRDTIDGRIENVMYDAEGPGSITRFWITIGGANVKDGILRIYIDGSDEPVLEGKATEIIGTNSSVGYPLSSALSDDAIELYRGRNLYMPIPYSKHCKVTYESEFITSDDKTQQSFYYNINYRTYEDNTIVESFTANTLESLQLLIKETNAALLASESIADQKIAESWNVSLNPSQTESMIIEQSNSALSEITINLKAEDMEQALRSTVLKISFDGNQTVWCPIGDFFATGHIWRNAQTWRTKVDAKTYTLSSSWIMPFKNSCDISIENLGDQDVVVDMQIAQCDYDWDERSMYFGSSWHQYTDIHTGVNKTSMCGRGGAVDLNYVKLQGQGVFVGDALSIYNPIQGWWGEGDEKIYVDGETFPSHFGTGTEDYYGYAWCRPEEFIHPFIAQPIGEGNITAGYTVNSRFRTLDAIPFKSSLRLDMELWHWSGTEINYAPTTFYYMLPGGVADMEIDTENAKIKIPIAAKKL